MVYSDISLKLAFLVTVRHVTLRPACARVELSLQRNRRRWSIIYSARRVRGTLNT